MDLLVRGASGKVRVLRCGSTDKTSGCPRCRSRVTGASQLGPEDQPMPSPGDIALCTTCGALNAFGDDLVVRTATIDDLANVAPEDIDRLHTHGGRAPLPVRVEATQGEGMNENHQHEHDSMLTYRREDDPVELHRCACGAVGSARRGDPISWFYGGTLYHRCAVCPRGER